jgi:2-polyprenyl-6-hydroxyphenyl methylase/3-demethylubiquinone-9 3-methyltransferase
MEIEAKKLQSPSLDPEEARRFAAFASEWWDDQGKFRALHAINPARLAFIRDALHNPGRGGDGAARPLTGLRLLDIGCGGGILAEPLARLGANVTAIDPASASIEAARAHAAAQGLAIDYRAALAEDLTAAGESFDAMIASEVLEHVADKTAFLASCRALTVTGGTLILSTINRTARSYALAIVMGERILGLLPRGTHKWERFVTIPELGEALSKAGFRLGPVKGIVLDPLSGEWRLSARDTSVNYIAAAEAV